MPRFLKRKAPHLLRWIVDDQLSGACARALAKFPDDSAGKAIVQRLVSMKLDERAAAVDVLVSRASWARFLLDRIASKALGPDIISTGPAASRDEFA